MYIIILELLYILILTFIVAIEAILNAADGTPRLINKYCNTSMLIGDSHKANLITTDIVMQAININDCELG